MDEINVAYEEIRHTPEFQNELSDLFANYVGRPSPLFYAKRLSDQLGGAQIYLKREDLNHTGAHKINHCLGEALLAKYMGKKKVIAETGAGQHGVALATACALVGISCEIHMGQVDIEKEHPNVVKMKILGAHLVAVTRGTATLKDAVDSAFEEYLKDPKTLFMPLVLWLDHIHFLKWFEIFNLLLVMKLKIKRISALVKIQIMWWHVLVAVQMLSVHLLRF